MLRTCCDCTAPLGSMTRHRPRSDILDSGPLESFVPSAGSWSLPTGVTVSSDSGIGFVPASLEEAPPLLVVVLKSSVTPPSIKAKADRGSKSTTTPPSLIPFSLPPPTGPSLLRYSAMRAIRVARINRLCRTSRTLEFNTRSFRQESFAVLVSHDTLCKVLSRVDFLLSQISSHKNHLNTCTVGGIRTAGTAWRFCL